LDRRRRNAPTRQDCPKCGVKASCNPCCNCAVDGLMVGKSIRSYSYASKQPIKDFSGLEIFLGNGPGVLALFFVGSSERLDGL
jgi:hypothetical protein